MTRITISIDTEQYAQAEQRSEMDSYFPENLLVAEMNKSEDENRHALDEHLNAPRQASLLDAFDDVKDGTIEALQAYSESQLAYARHALDIATKWMLQSTFKDNLWVIYTRQIKLSCL